MPFKVFSTCFPVSRAALVRFFMHGYPKKRWRHIKIPFDFPYHLSLFIWK